MKVQNLPILFASIFFTASAFAECSAIQAGHGTIDPNQLVTRVSLPCSYPNTNYSIVVSGAPGAVLYSTDTNDKTNTAFTVRRQTGMVTSSQFDWIAVQN